MGRTDRDCPWDLLPWAYEVGYHYGNLDPGERWADFRRRMRAVTFECAARGVDERAQMDCDSAWCPTELRREHGERIHYWRSRYFAEVGPTNIFARIGFLALVSAAITFGGMIAFAVLWQLWRAKSWWLAALIPLVLIAIPIVTWRIRSATHRRGIRRSLFDGCCPTCGYTLADKMIGGVVRPVSWIPVGPARCPECGTHWPLVPPPVPVR